jgi:hypothetical protein
MFRARYDGRLVAVPQKYGYVGDGDVLGFDHSSRKFRTLFRRNSTHNSFLVTERCNNYCLMCSQPPNDVDDSWILNERELAVRCPDNPRADVHRGRDPFGLGGLH